MSSGRHQLWTFMYRNLAVFLLLPKTPGSSLLHQAGPQRFHVPHSWRWQTRQRALSRKLQHMARGFGDASRPRPIFPSVSAPPLIWSACVGVKTLTTSETEETLSCFLGTPATPNSGCYRCFLPFPKILNCLPLRLTHTRFSHHPCLIAGLWYLFPCTPSVPIGLFNVDTVSFHFTMSPVFFLHCYIHIPHVCPCQYKASS